MRSTATRDAQLVTLPRHEEFVERLMRFDDGDDVRTLIYEPLAQRHAGEQARVMDLMGSFFSILTKSQARFPGERYAGLLIDGLHSWVELLVDDREFVAAYQEQLKYVD